MEPGTCDDQHVTDPVDCSKPMLKAAIMRKGGPHQPERDGVSSILREKTRQTGMGGKEAGGDEDLIIVSLVSQNNDNL